MSTRCVYAMLALLTPALLAGSPPELGQRVICGYQGWFACPTSPSDSSWIHWSRNGARLAPGNATFDLWPDVSAYPAGSRCDTDFRHADGSSAEVYSAAHAGVINLHFKWMREHGIDGILLQRFGTQLRYQHTRAHADRVLGHVRRAAAAEQRVWALMYDLSGLAPEAYASILADWRALRGIERDAGYLYAHNRPLVGLWGIGFNEPGRPNALHARELVEAFRAEGIALVLGVPLGWRTGTRDANPDPAFLSLYERAAALLPWSVGRYTDDASARAYGATLRDDLTWTAARGIRLLPCVFPGFSWHNLKNGPLDQIPRRQGAFLRTQFETARTEGLDSAYVAMFDEFDEGTALLPFLDRPPVATANQFVPREEVPPDHYLRIAGEAAGVLKTSPAR